MSKVTAKSEASKIIKKACITKPNELSLEEIILFLNGPEVISENLNGYEGKFMSLDDVSIIKIDNKIKNEGRRRFTLAHELGHFSLHKEKNYIACAQSDLNDWSGRKEIETEANYFASEILMPTEIFTRESKKEKFSKAYLINLASEFNTSITATAIKYVESGHDPIFCVCSDGNKILWKFVNSEFPFKIDFKNLKQVPNISVTYELQNTDKQIADSEEIDPVTWLINAEDSELRFYEDALNIEYYGYTLSFISVR